MRILLFISLSLLFFNCEDKKTNQNKTTSATDSKTKVTPVEIKTDTIVEPEREFPELTDANAMEFFLQYSEDLKEDKVRLTTDFGEIDILLFDNVRFHKANFIFLTKQGYFNGTQFHRVVNNFIIQGGNTDDIEIAKKRTYIGKYLLPNDSKRGYRHSRGVISMPSSEIENPHKLASPYEFFIVQKDAYHLDGDYTIFGRVIRGMDVVDKIAAQPTDNAEWPLHNVYIKKAEIIK
ncbi:cyclophilin family peptidyl-prolyl cis-trans isomerase [Flavobacteriaceae bacterium MAR_2010_72]|nr:cyclophilin family peptidyl-prolyl cis-trans isomerase [Flavobacteriaceae bacterium MAR_2010_72]